MQNPPDDFELAARIVEAFVSGETDARVVELLNDAARAVREHRVVMDDPRDDFGQAAGIVEGFAAGETDGDVVELLMEVSRAILDRAIDD